MTHCSRLATWIAVSALALVSAAVPAKASTVLLTDDFNDNSLDPAKWTINLSIPQGGAAVNEVNQHIEFTGRGHLNTLQQFNPAAQPEAGLRIRGEWTFVSGGDFLQILTRSDGTPSGGYGETQNGIEFFVQGPASGGDNMTIQGRGGASVPGGSINGAGALGMAAGETYTFDIRDDGQFLYFAMKQVGGTKQRQVFARSTSVLATNLITFHNRESGNRSNLDNVVIDSPTAAAPHAPVFDNFNDNWIDPDIWNVVVDGIPQTPKGVAEVNGRIELTGRAHLNTRSQYNPLTAPNDGVRIRGQWTFVSGDDFLQILTRSDGAPSGGYGETNAGVQFQVSSAGGGNNMTIVGSNATVSGVVNAGALNAAAGETYDFDIRDDGYNLFFTMRQVGGAKQRTVIAASSSVLAQDLIAFHNREGGRVSYLDNVRIDSPVSNTVGLGGPILLQDRFNDNSLDATKWTVNTAIPQGGASVTETNNRIELVGRAHLNTVQDFNPATLGGLTVRGRWTFQSGDDFMQILTRSDGTPAGGYGETNRGVQFLASETSTANNVSIGGAGGASVTGPVNSNLTILAGETYDFQLVDSGNGLSMLLKQVGGPKAAVATAASTSTFATNLVTFHNRESGRVSHLDNVVIAAGLPEALALAGGGAFTVRQVQSTGTIASLADADALLAGAGVAAQNTSIVRTINFGPGSQGLFGGDTPFAFGAATDFALQATGTIGILKDGDYVFGLNIDDGARLMIDGQPVILENSTDTAGRNVYGHVELSAGLHQLDLTFFQRDGNSQLELFYFNGSMARVLAEAVPEPATSVLMGLGGIALALAARRRGRHTGTGR